MADEPRDTGNRWRNRIVGHDVVDADQLLANPKNARVHPLVQQKAMLGVFDSVGWIDEATVNINTGYVVDGHMRIALAISEGQPVPVRYVDLTEEEEAVALATYDPVGDLAVLDLAMYQQLVDSIGDVDGSVAHILARTGEGPGFTDDTAIDKPTSDDGTASSSDGDDLPAPSKEDFAYGYLHWGATHVDCTGTEIETLTRLHAEYRAEHDGRDKGFLEWLTAGRTTDAR